MNDMKERLQSIIEDIDCLRDDIDLILVQQVEGTEDCRDLLSASNHIGDAIDALYEVLDRQ